MSEPQASFEWSTDFDNAIDRASAEQRIDGGYWDIFHHYHETPREVRKSLLAAMGWDIAGPEAIDRERERRFHEHLTRVAPATLVVGEADRSVPVTVPGTGDGQRFRFQLNHEDGSTSSGDCAFESLAFSHRVVVGGEHWLTRRFTLPPETPLGYHELHIGVGEAAAESALIVCPERAYLPERLQAGGRSAGFNVTLYGLRSARNWGCGDFTDLRALAKWAHDEIGFSFIGVNPLHALHNRVPYNTSPYLPLSLYYKNLIYVDIEAVPDFAACRLAQRVAGASAFQDKLAQLRDSEIVGYQQVDRIKRRFLKMLFREFRRNRTSARWRAFDLYCEREGDMLRNFALYCALDEALHKQDRNLWTWRQWPEQYHSPHTVAAQRFAAQHPRLLQFYQYIQFVIDEQLSAAQAALRQSGLEIGLYHDLALATDSCGADLWAYGSFYVNGCRVGAPPDDFSPNGQDWAFPPPNADAHYANGYRMYRESIRKVMQHGGALRIDHVMRLFRLFWIPEGARAQQGTYVRDRATDLMRILALESVRARNVVIGEDLGTVTDEIREMLARFGILSYRLFYFEKHRDGSFKRSSEYPRQALVASSTHDLATMCGFWLGRDIAARHRAGLADDHGASQQLEHRQHEKQQMVDVLHAENLLPTGYGRDARQIPEVDGPLHAAIIAFLARVPSMLLLLNQEDLTKETEQQNLPGSTAEYPNWQRKMRATIEELSRDWAPYVAMLRLQLESSARSALR